MHTQPKERKFPPEGERNDNLKKGTTETRSVSYLFDNVHLVYPTLPVKENNFSIVNQLKLLAVVNKAPVVVAGANHPFAGRLRLFTTNWTKIRYAKTSGAIQGYCIEWLDNTRTNVCPSMPSVFQGGDRVSGSRNQPNGKERGNRTHPAQVGGRIRPQHFPCA